MNRFLAVLALTALVGCASDGVWRDLDEKARPVANYRQDALVENLRQLPVALEFDCPQTAMINERGAFGGINVVGHFQIRDLVQRECESFVGVNFRAATQRDAEYVVLKVSMTEVRVLRKWSDAVSDMSFRIEIVHPSDATKRSYFSRAFSGSATSRKRAAGVVPVSAYAAMQDVLVKFGRDLASDFNAVERLKADFPNGRVCPGPHIGNELGSFSWTEGSADVHDGRCTWRCNDDDPSMVRTVAVSDFIQQRSGEKLGNLARERIRIVVDKDDFDGTTKTWTVWFRAFARTKYAFTFNQTERLGYCTADLGLLGLDGTQATSDILRYVQKQVERFGRARMRTSRMDAQNELLTIEFSVE